MALFGKKKKQADEVAPASQAAPAAPGSQSNDEFAAADLLASATAAGAVRDPGDVADPDNAGATTAFDDPAFASDNQSAQVDTGMNGYGAATSHRATKKGAVVGLNIGSDTIKAVELRAKGSELVVTAMGMVPTPEESIANGVVMSAGSIARAVRTVFAQAGIKTKKTVVSIAGTNALVVRVIEVPRMTDAELKDNLAMDADRYIPFPAAEVVMDHQALRELPSDPDAANMEVLLAAAQSEVVDSLIKVVQDAKLDPQAIDVEPLAAARALMPDSGAVNYNDVTALINIGAEGTEISVLRGNILVFTRTVPVGGNRITEALVEAFGLSRPEAERLKRETADATPPAGAVVNNLAPATTPTAAAGFGALAAAAAPVSAVAPAAMTPASPPASTGEEHSDWGDFEAFAESTEEDADSGAASNATDFGAAQVDEASAGDSAPPSTADPFDLDFFDQGPQSSEPPEQHGQKEPADDTPIFSFDEVSSDADDESQASSSQPSDTAEPGRAAIPSAFDFAFDVDEDEEFLPASSSDASGSANAGTPFVVNEQDDFTAQSAMDEDGTTMVDFSDVTASLTAQGGAAGAATSSGAAASGAAASGAAASGAAASGAAASGAAASSAEPDASPDAPASFGFSVDETPEPPVAAEQSTQGAETQPVAADEMTVEAGQPETASNQSTSDNAEDFDLDELFGDTPATGDLSPEPAFSSESELSAGPDALAGAVGAGATGAGVMGAAGDAESVEFDIESLGAGLSDAEASGDGIDAATLYSVVQPALDSLVDEVRRSLEYHASRAPDAPVRQVVLIGGGAKLKNMDAYVTQALGMPAVIGDPLALVTVAVPKLDAQYAVENSPMFAVALGLALRELT